MRFMSKWMLAAAFALALSQGAQAQRQPGGFQPGGGGFGGMGGGFGGGMNLRSLVLASKPLQEELKLSESQVEKFKAFSDKQLEEMRKFGFGQSSTDEEQLERLKTQVKLLEERIQLIKSTLEKDQLKRLTQLEYQQMGMGAFTNDRVVKALKISDEQKDKIKTINEDLQKESRELQRGAFGGGGFDREKMAEMQKKMTNLRDEAKEKVEKALTDDQRSQWKEMLGEAFDMSKLTPMFRPMPKD